MLFRSGTTPPPDPTLLPSSLPVRVREEQTNSLNNRFKPDPEIQTRGVLSIDDDIRIPCSDVERAFAAWRQRPGQLVGFFPRLIESRGSSGSKNSDNQDPVELGGGQDSTTRTTDDEESSPQDLVFRGEEYVVQQGRYNVVLTGAAFLDASSAFSAYWSDEVQPARAVVDQVFNGEDLLMNFVLSNRYRSRTSTDSKGAANANTNTNSAEQVDQSGNTYLPIAFIRPSRRLDISKLSRVGISHDMGHFEDTTAVYLKTFVRVFGEQTLLAQDYEAALEGKRAPWFCGTTIGCLYM